MLRCSSRPNAGLLPQSETILISQSFAQPELASLGEYCSGVQTLRGEHLSRCIGRLAGKVRPASSGTCWLFPN